MKKISKYIFSGVAAFAMLSACSYLDPLPNGAYTDENFDDYPELLRGFVDKIYNDCRPVTFYSSYYSGISTITDEAVYSSATTAKRIYSEGKGAMTSNPFESFWTNAYTAINYANLFLVDNRGYNTQYMLNQEADLALRRSLQGDAYGLRAWFLFDLLRMFAGEGTDGKMWGVPIRLLPTEYESIDYSEICRASIDDCCKQILKDCDSACVYLHLDNRDYPDDAPQEITVTGSARYTTLNQIAINALRSQVYLYWASPAWNPGVAQDDAAIVERYSSAAKYAAVVMKHKLERESTLTGGFDPMNKVEWTNPNSQEIVWSSRTTAGTTTWETSLYPIGFGGEAAFAPTQNLVDCFPAANGYPITDTRSKYNASKPYENRDPRFYSTINYDGAKVTRNTDPSDVMYTFDTKEGGKDAPNQKGTSATGYYVRKFLYTGWNPYDAVIQNAPRPLMIYRWTEVCLMFAEAASHVVSPTAELHGYSAKQALAYLRKRPSYEGTAGVGSNSDPYLDECASAGGEKFLDLVKNEWKVETCFEGKEFYNSRRWASSVSEINVPIKRVVITGDGTTNNYSYETVTTLNYPSLWQPLPYMEVRRCTNLLQNKGWESWR